MRTKILLLLAIIFCGALTANAQINKGRFLLGGSFSLDNEKYNEPSLKSKIESLNTNIQFGKVVKENTVVGLILSYSYSNYYYNSMPDSDFNKSNQNSSGAGIFYRKYIKLAKDFYFFGEVDAEYFHSKKTQEYVFQNGNRGSKFTSDGGSVSFIPGISYTVCKRMQIELVMPNIISLSYSHLKTDYINTTPPFPRQEGNVFSFNTNLNSNLLSSFGIGFKFLLGK